MLLTEKLTSIAAAIREKGGTTEKLTLDAMPTAIAALSTGGGDMEPIVLTGDMTYFNCYDCWTWFIEKYGDKITTNKINKTENMFNWSDQIKEIPFEINMDNSSAAQGSNMFQGCNKLEYIAPINNAYFSTCGKLFNGCYKLRNLPVMEGFKVRGDSTCNGVFYNCYSLRNIPTSILKEIRNEKATSSYSSQFDNMITNCYALDEIKGINPTTGTFTSNVFSNTFNYCYHLKGITFLTQEDGTPYTAQWKNQTIDLSKYVGWAGYSSAHKDITTNHNSGITEDKEVGINKGSYADLKDDPDWWSREYAFSRFGHNAAVELINSLPDTEAYLTAEKASNNIVKFYSNAGYAIDGGSVSDLTEEEVAVAAAKGWSIAYGT